MAKSDISSVDEYIAAQPPAARGLLERVRSAIRKAVPSAEEVISYKMPTYTLGGVMVIHFAGWKKHYSLYPASDDLLSAFENDLERYDVEKSTIRFPLSEPVPERLIERIATFRVQEITERKKT